MRRTITCKNSCEYLSHDMFVSKHFMTHENFNYVNYVKRSWICTHACSASEYVFFFAVHRYFAVTTMQQKLLPFAALVVVHNCF